MLWQCLDPNPKAIRVETELTTKNFLLPINPQPARYLRLRFFFFLETAQDRIFYFHALIQDVQGCVNFQDSWTFILRRKTGLSSDATRCVLHGTISSEAAIRRKPESGDVRNPILFFVIGFLGFWPLKCGFCVWWPKKDEFYSDFYWIRYKQNGSGSILGVSNLQCKLLNPVKKNPRDSFVLGVNCDVDEIQNFAVY